MDSLVVTCVFISSDVVTFSLVVTCVRMFSLVVTCVFISSDVWIH